jgi:hypothetical protein
MIDPMEEALLLIRGDACEKTFGKGYACISDPWRIKGAGPSDESGWCASCIAHHGLRFSQRFTLRSTPHPSITAS